MPDVITSLSKMFADYAKVFRQIETSADTATLQNVVPGKLFGGGSHQS